MPTKPCPTCGQLISESAKKCVYCGHFTAVCPKCGKVIDSPKTIFCVHCGEKIGEEPKPLIPNYEKNANGSASPCETGEDIANVLYEQWRSSTAVGKFYGGAWLALHVILTIFGVIFFGVGGMIISNIVSSIVNYRICSNLAGWMKKQDIDVKNVLRKIIDDQGIERVLEQEKIHDPVYLVVEGLFLAYNEDQLALERKRFIQNTIFSSLSAFFLAGTVVVFILMMVFTFSYFVNLSEDFGGLTAILFAIFANPCFYLELIFSLIENGLSKKRRNTKMSAKSIWLQDTAYANKTDFAKN